MSLFGRAEAQRARFYGALADSVDAGLPIAQALALASETDRAIAAAWAEGDPRSRLEAGSTLSEALAATGGLTPLEVHGLAAGERSGRVLDVLERLERRFAARAQALERLHAGFVYPLALLHAAILLPRLSLLVLQSLGAYLAAVLPPLAALYGLVGLAWLAARAAARIPAVRAARDRLLLASPFVGRLARADASADLGEALALLVGAGIPLGEALGRAAEGTGNLALAGAVRRVGARIAAEGCPLAEALEPERGVIAPLLVDAVRAGEPTGKLDDALDRAARALRADAERAMSVVVKLVPVAVYLAVAAYIAWVVVSAYANIYRSLPGL